MNPELLDYLLEKVSGEPLEKRAGLYRLIVLQCGDRKVADACRSLADELDEIERRHRQLVLDFKRAAR